MNRRSHSRPSHIVRGPKPIFFGILWLTFLTHSAQCLTLSDGFTSFISAVGHYTGGSSDSSSLEVDFAGTISAPEGAWTQTASFLGQEEYIDQTTIPYTRTYIPNVSEN